MPVFFCCVLVFIFWLRYETKKANRLSDNCSDSFWQKEQDANLVRKKDISSLPYIKIPLDNLPFLEIEDETLNSLENEIKRLSNEKIVNLTGKTNTDLKCQYGLANLEYLSTYDHNFTLLARTLYQWGKYLYEHDYINEAKTVLEYGITCNTDVSGNYILLATIYNQYEDIHAIRTLLEKAESLNTIMKTSIINSLKKIMKH